MPDRNLIAVTYLPFEEARKIVHQQGLNTTKEFRTWSNGSERPAGIPKYPDISTGVDGLQKVCNRLVLICLPWTGAEYEQVIGRLHRQGSVFDKVEVIIPLVTLRRGDAVWSWDRLRLQRIEWKRTLADAAVDGVIPEGQLPSKEEMHEQSLAALEDWYAALRQTGL